MRVINHKFTIRSVLFSKYMTFLYLIVLVFFIYKSLKLLPTWLTIRDKAHEAQLEYEKKIQEIEDKKNREVDKETEIGKERYEKEFFNKLEEGENLIVIYSEQKEETKNEVLQERKMFWWEEWQQSIKVWWKNLDL